MSMIRIRRFLRRIGMNVVFWFRGNPNDKSRINKIYKKLVKDAIVIDIGAFEGGVTDYFLRFNPKKVFCIEPNPKYYHYLKKRFEKNKIVKVMNCAISNKNCKGILYVDNFNPTYATIDDNFKQVRSKLVKLRYTKEIEVNIIDTKNLLKKCYASLDDKLFIKIDAEGNDWRIIQSMPFASNIRFEFHSDFKNNLHRCLDGAKKLGICKFNAIIGLRQKLAFKDYASSDDLLLFLEKYQEKNKRFRGDILVKYRV